jgi:hypothetical protein
MALMIRAIAIIHGCAGSSTVDKPQSQGAVVMYSSTASAVMWVVSARCPLCQKPLVLRHNHAYRHVVVCLGHPVERSLP